MTDPNFQPIFRPITDLKSIDKFITQNESLSVEYQSKITGHMDLDKNPDLEIIGKVASHLKTVVDIYRVSGQYRYKTIYRSKNVSITFSKKIEVK